MKADQPDTKSNSQKLDTTRKSLGDTPINAVNRLKSINDNIEIMKNRYLVLKRRDEHNKYKTLDQQKKLSLHHMIHDRLKNEREELRKSLEEIRDTKEIKERSQSLRKQIREGITSARLEVARSNLQKYDQISSQAIKNQDIIQTGKQEQLSANKERALTLKKLEQQEKQAIEKKLKEKRQHILMNKKKESSGANQMATEREKILEKMQRDQMELIKETSKSMEKSRLMSQKYTEIMMNLPSFKTKKPQKPQKNSFLPTINNKHNNSLQVVIV